MVPRSRTHTSWRVHAWWTADPDVPLGHMLGGGAEPVGLCVCSRRRADKQSWPRSHQLRGWSGGMRMRMKCHLEGSWFREHRHAFGLSPQHLPLRLACSWCRTQSFQPRESLSHTDGLGRNCRVQRREQRNCLHSFTSLRAQPRGLSLSSFTLSESLPPPMGYQGRENPASRALTHQDIWVDSTGSLKVGESDQ